MVARGDDCDPEAVVSQPWTLLSHVERPGVDGDNGARAGVTGEEVGRAKFAKILAALTAIGFPLRAVAFLSFVVGDGSKATDFGVAATFLVFWRWAAATASFRLLRGVALGMCSFEATVQSVLLALDSVTISSSELSSSELQPNIILRGAGADVRRRLSCALSEASGRPAASADEEIPSIFFL